MGRQHIQGKLGGVFTSSCADSNAGAEYVLGWKWEATYLPGNGKEASGTEAY